MVQVRSAQDLTKLGIAIFEAVGATSENARGVVSSLVGANLAEGGSAIDGRRGSCLPGQLRRGRRFEPPGLDVLHVARDADDTMRIVSGQVGSDE